MKRQQILSDILGGDSVSSKNSSRRNSWFSDLDEEEEAEINENKMAPQFGAVTNIAAKAEGDSELDMSYALQDELGFYMDVLADDFAQHDAQGQLVMN